MDLQVDWDHKNLTEGTKLHSSDDSWLRHFAKFILGTKLEDQVFLDHCQLIFPFLSMRSQ